MTSRRVSLSSTPRWLHLVLAAMALCSATLFGAWSRGAYDPSTPLLSLDLLLSGRVADALSLLSSVLIYGLPYAVGVTTFFITHEMGHFLACRHHDVACTWPFFIPAPPPMHLGTLGAVIVIRSRIPNRRALFDIGVAGPLAGAVVALVLVIWGVLASPQNAPLAGPLPGEQWGDSLLTWWLKQWLRPDLGPGAPLHPIFMAGWVGLLATSMNLIPAGQLDGGHLVYSLAPRLHRSIGALSAAFLVGLVATSLLHWGTPSVWLIWAVVVVVWGRRHPSLLDESEGLDWRRVALAAIAVLVLVISFMPHPIAFSDR